MANKRLIILFLFLIFSLIYSKDFSLKYPISDDFKVDFIELKEFNFKYGKRTYKIDYNNFFINCYNSKNIYSDSNITCDTSNNKLEYYKELYNDKLIKKLIKKNSFYVNYYNNITKFDKNLLIGTKNKYEVFFNDKKEILFYSKKTFGIIHNYKISKSNSLLYLNIVFYLYKNNIPFNFKDIKLNPKNNEYNVSINYNFIENSFKINRSFNLVVNIKASEIVSLYIQDVGNNISRN
jgi:hypothetical protein